MRITCPNCGAKYEVPEEVIPVEGRDVQCSNCGDTWFQDRSGDMPAAEDRTPETAPGSAPGSADEDQRADAAAQGETPADDDVAEPEDDAAWVETPPEDTPEDAPEDGTVTEPQPDTGPEPEAEAEPEPEAEPERTELDPAVAEILRQEAEHESRLRAAEAGGLESQAELGLDEAPGDEASRRSREARDRMARMRGEAPDGAIEPSGSRSDLLPDIEEINSTLRTDEDDTPPEALEMVAQKGTSGRSGFARGFGLMILIAILAALVYANAPRITAQMPALAGPVGAYVGAVDNARVWLDNRLSGFIPQ